MKISHSHLPFPATQIFSKCFLTRTNFCRVALMLKKTDCHLAGSNETEHSLYLKRWTCLPYFQRHSCCFWKEMAELDLKVAYVDLTVPLLSYRSEKQLYWKFEQTFWSHFTNTSSFFWEHPKEKESIGNIICSVFIDGCMKGNCNLIRLFYLLHTSQGLLPQSDWWELWSEWKHVSS